MSYNNWQPLLVLAADGFSIYIKGLPMNATPAMLDDEFKKFGTIKPNGIQVRSNRVRFHFSMTLMQLIFNFLETHLVSTGILLWIC